ncbi:hypothetical protein ACT6QG_07900 [Xanthobacter sp. TB0136]|uniref:hypothetical protein n=1 Tax=Xanthobacter sp. TB0136 TaxID=3459177 RepID=UPI00403992D9
MPPFFSPLAIALKALVAGLEFVSPPEDDAHALAVFLTGNLRGVVEKVRAARNADAEEAEPVT